MARWLPPASDPRRGRLHLGANDPFTAKLIAICRNAYRPIVLAPAARDLEGRAKCERCVDVLASLSFEGTTTPKET